MQMHVVREPPGSERSQPDDGRLIAESWRVPERFGVVFDRNAAAIHGYIARRLDAADDLVGETFLVAFGRRGGYDPEQPSPRPWLYGIATRLVSRRRRDEVRFFRAIARTGIDPAADPAAEPVADEGARQDAAAALGHPRTWVATGDEAVGFYQRCGWVAVEHLRLESTGISTTILAKPPLG